MNPRKLKMTSMTLLMLPCVFTLAGIVSTTAAAASKNDRCWMTGGGSVFTAEGVRVTHGFVLNCDTTRGPNNLEINWGGNRFHLTTLIDASCSFTGDPKPPTAGFNTYKGYGEGYYSGEGSNSGLGVYAEWAFTDNGEPGKYDIATIKIYSNDNATILLEVVEGNLNNGNQQAHGSDGDGCPSSGGQG